MTRQEAMHAKIFGKDKNKSWKLAGHFCFCRIRHHDLAESFILRLKLATDWTHLKVVSLGFNASWNHVYRSKISQRMSTIVNLPKRCRWHVFMQIATMSVGFQVESTLFSTFLSSKMETDFLLPRSLFAQINPADVWCASAAQSNCAFCALYIQLGIKKSNCARNMLPSS